MPAEKIWWSQLKYYCLPVLSLIFQRPTAAVGEEAQVPAKEDGPKSLADSYNPPTPVTDGPMTDGGLSNPPSGPSTPRSLSISPQETSAATAGNAAATEANDRVANADQGNHACQARVPSHLGCLSYSRV